MEKEKGIVLVVEDEVLLLEAIGMKLHEEGLKSKLCSSGKEALEYLAKTENLPILIWLDYHLTDMDGLEFMTKVKDVKKWEEIPVIVVSNSASKEKIHSVMLLGAKKYIVKAESKLKDIIKAAKEIIHS
jgi:two-component system chemotaxis response regulator CheY